MSLASTRFKPCWISLFELPVERSATAPDLQAGEQHTFRCALLTES